MGNTRVESWWLGSRLQTGEEFERAWGVRKVQGTCLPELLDRLGEPP